MDDPDEGTSHFHQKLLRISFPHTFLLLIYFGSVCVRGGWSEKCGGVCNVVDKRLWDIRVGACGGRLFG